ncbi:MAG: transglutaminase domain-containing protein [Prevotella sp.]|nr:transglutaminase domain-containing protein [Prevotella sp.]
MKKRFLSIVVVFLTVLPLCAQQTEKVYFDFLYRYLPLPDKTDYTEAFYQTNIRLSLQARKEMPWGKKVPEREFKHFVLPPRVNNENLDSARQVFYQELKDRVRTLSMKDAILEVNHWCHEKVVYRPSDARTSSPLATVKTAYGRCGEESTFLVAALRAVCIPARQVYTPRWAHTDDNHAWVEAWADGKWYFLGACEPEPVLNLGWFNESASRGMLMHTKVFGHYDGPEEVMLETPCYTEINVVNNYAPTSKVTVKIVDENGKPVDHALVAFKLYNYAEFYTVARKYTDRKGMTSLTAGKGDMLVWVTKDGKVAYRKVSFQQDHEVRLVLRDGILPQRWDLEVTPPPVQDTLPPVTDAQRKENTRRLEAEDAIRKAYEQTMPDERYRGNHEVIYQFLRTKKDTIQAKYLLGVLSDKDLRDVTLEVLQDNELSFSTDTSLIYRRYVLSPRVENEWLTPYKHFFRKELSDIQSPAALVDWCRKNITIVDDQNPQALRMLPMSVYRERKTDKLGRDIFFVSAARSLGMPARINPVDGKLQYYEHAQWKDVLFEQQQAVVAPQGRLLLDYMPAPYYDDPKYYIHFTISKLVDGEMQLMNFPEDATWKKDFSQGVMLDEGEYMLTVGTRMAKGNVLVHMEKFTIMKDRDTRLSFTMRESKENIQVIGSLNAEDLYYDTAIKQDKSILSTTGRGYYVIGIVAPSNEPTNHALRDIALYQQAFEQWGRKIILLLEDEEAFQRFNFSEFSNLPNTVVWGIDKQHIIFEEIRREMKLTNNTLPVFLICDSFNRVVFIQQGYTIGLGEQMMKAIQKL